MDYIQTRSSMTTAGMFVLGFLHGAWLITLPPFSWYDSFLMYFYGHFLDWGNSLSGGFLLGVFFVVDMLFVYFKYLFVGHVVAASAFQKTPV
jgi:hypothetical protein